MRVKVTDEANAAAKLAAEKIQEQVSKRNEMLALMNTPEVKMFWKLFVEEDVDVRLENLSVERASRFKTMSQADFIANASLEAIMKTYRVYPKSVEAARDHLMKERNKILKRINERQPGNKE